MSLLIGRDFSQYPKFRHNLWLTHEENPSITYLTVSNGTYEVSTEDALNFLKIRRYCNGFNDFEGISRKSGLNVKEIKKMVKPLMDAEIIHPTINDPRNLTEKEIEKTFIAAATLFGQQIEETNIALDIFTGLLSKEVCLGWLCETYHFIKQFPFSLELAAQQASGELREILSKYAAEEKGHEKFILQSLMKAGFSKDEIEASVPLVSTKTIDLLLRELFLYEPCAALIVAGIIEADNFNEKTAEQISDDLHKKHGFPIDLLDPFYEHVIIDSKLNHKNLIKKHKNLIRKIDKSKVNDIMNKLHDIKHAFDLQGFEIKKYYGESSGYLPRQKVFFFSI